MKKHTILMVSVALRGLVRAALVTALLAAGVLASPPHALAQGPTPAAQAVSAPGLAPESAVWNALGRGLNWHAWCIAVSGSNVYVGGGFTEATNPEGALVPTLNVARWNGSTWSTLGQGVDNTVWAIAVSGSDVYVGGDFGTVYNANGSAVTVNNIAKWNGDTWSALGQGVDNIVYAIAVDGSNVYIGGQFSNATNTAGAKVEVNNVARWDGTGWTPLGRGVSEGYYGVFALAVKGSDVFVGGGGFQKATNADGSFVTANGIARWDGSAWSTLGQGLAGTAVGDARTIAVHGSDVYVGGTIPTVKNGNGSTVPVNNIARWDGSNWFALGKGLPGDFYHALALAVIGSDVYVGGSFQTATHADDSVVTVNGIARWDGASWSALGKGVSGEGGGWPRVHGLAASGSDLYVAGQFISAKNADDSTVMLKRVARYGGASQFQFFLPHISR